MHKPHVIAVIIQQDKVCFRYGRWWFLNPPPTTPDMFKIGTNIRAQQQKGSAGLLSHTHITVLILLVCSYPHVHVLVTAVIQNSVGSWQWRNTLCTQILKASCTTFWWRGMSSQMPPKSLLRYMYLLSVHWNWIIILLTFQSKPSNIWSEYVLNVSTEN